MLWMSECVHVFSPSIVMFACEGGCEEWGKKKKNRRGEIRAFNWKTFPSGTSLN